VTLLRIENGASSNDRLSVPGSAGRREVLNEDTFNHMIAVERKRTERTKQPFLLMLLETSQQQDRAKNTGSLESMVSALLTSIRETDVIGWYKDRTVIGVMYTGLLVSNKDSVLNMILNRASAALGDKLTSEQFSQVSISFHFFPDDWDEKSSGRPSNPALYPDLFTTNKERRSVVMTKRAMDIAGSTLMLLVCAPVFIAIAAAVKLSSGAGFFPSAAGRSIWPALHIPEISLHANQQRSHGAQGIRHQVHCQPGQPAARERRGRRRVQADKRSAHNESGEVSPPDQPG